MEGRFTVLGRKQTHETGAGCSLSKRGSRSRGLQSVMRPSARPIAKIALPPSGELNDTDVTCAPKGAVNESGMCVGVVPRDSDHR